MRRIVQIPPCYLLPIILKQALHVRHQFLGKLLGVFYIPLNNNIQVRRKTEVLLDRARALVWSVRQA